MKTRRLTAFTALLMLLCGCSTQARVEARRNTEISLEQARVLARVDCTTRVDCDELWQRTSLYVAQRSVTSIRHSDDTTIETAVPHTFGMVYVWATRTIDGSGVTTIRVKGMCRGMYRADGDPGWLYGSCAKQIRSIETDFRSFIGAAS